MLKLWGPNLWGEYLPETFILPRYSHLSIFFLCWTFHPCRQARDLNRAMREKGSFWIVKPPNMWCGMGIKVIKNFSEVQATNSLLCVQRYIKQPLLINNLKFDIRVYLLVTSVEPLRLYLYKEGLARFATEEYTNDPSQVTNNFIHLTNFSINKDSDNFIHNSDPDQAKVWPMYTILFSI